VPFRPSPRHSPIGASDVCARTAAEQRPPSRRSRPSTYGRRTWMTTRAAVGHAKRSRCCWRPAAPRQRRYRGRLQVFALCIAAPEPIHAGFRGQKPPGMPTTPGGSAGPPVMGGREHHPSYGTVMSLRSLARSARGNTVRSQFGDRLAWRSLERASAHASPPRSGSSNSS
jgi:hypothetical protein